MDNHEFLSVVGDSFKKFLETGSRSNEKLKILHGAIAKDLQKRLGNEYWVQSLGVGDGKEMKIDGRYIDKAVDITILKKDKPIAGIGVKFVMQNYSQNSNNYFENMLGETANIRCANIPYFQIFIIPDKLPYYKNDGTFQKWEEFSSHNSAKYLTLSKDDIQTSIHTPTKTLLFVIHLPEIEKDVKYYCLDAPILYISFYLKKHLTDLSDLDYDMSSCVILDKFEESTVSNKMEFYKNKSI